MGLVMRRLSVLMLLIFLCAFSAGYGRSSRFVIVDGGKSRAVIVVPDKANAEIIFSAEELSRYIKMITGASISIVRSKEVTESQRAGNMIVIGNADLAEVGDKLRIKAGDKVEVGGFVWQVDGNVLWLNGKSIGPFEKRFGNWEHGIWNGVCRFAEEYLGVCWLWPGELGFVCPEVKTLSIEIPLDGFSESPVIKRRRIRDRIYQKYWRQVWSEVGIGESRYNWLADESYKWQKFHQGGFSIDIIPGAHGFVDWWEKYHKEHPDWFAMQLDGTRNYPVDTNFGSPSTAKLCVSNPEVIDAVANNVVRYYKENPSPLAEVYRAGINDNTDVGICCCSHCRSWDVPEKAGAWTYRYRTGVWKYHYVTDRYVRFWNAIAKRVVKECPDKYISVNAYGCLEEPPWENIIEYKNILLTFTGFDYLNAKRLKRDRDWWDRWRGKTKGKMNLRCNVFVEGYGFPLVYIHQMDRDFKKSFKDVLLGVEYEALYNYWSTNGLNYYMLMKLLWNPELDIDSELDRYCKKGFGRAGDEIKRYFLAVEGITNEIAKHNWHWRGEFLRGIAGIYTREKISELQGYLDRAKRLVSGDEARRVSFLEEGLKYALVQSDFLRAKMNKKSRADVQAARGKREEFFRNMKYPFSVAYPAVKYWQRYNRNLLD